MGVVNKTGIARNVAQATGLSVTQAYGAVEATLLAVQEALDGGEEVRLIGFATLVPFNQPAHERRNPQTGDPVSVPERRRVRVRLSRQLLAYLNKP